jgi:hypothetical protein
MGGLIDWLVADGKVALLAMAILLIEAVAAALFLSRGRASFAANWISGLSLMGAVLASLAGLGAGPVLACLSVAFVSHLFYLFFLRHGR